MEPEWHKHENIVTSWEREQRLAIEAHRLRALNVELLETLEALEEAALTPCGTHNIDPIMPALNDSCTPARAAIKKARTP